MTSFEAFATWELRPNRTDAIEFIEEQSAARVPELVPLRYERMGVSPFAFFRGSAIIMAHDLAAQPTTGIEVQCIGDAHLANFGIFASPTRHLVFDVNDFDETAPGHAGNGTSSASLRASRSAVATAIFPSTTAAMPCAPARSNIARQ